MNGSDWRALRSLRLRALRASPESFFGDLSTEGNYSKQAWRDELSDHIWVIAKSRMRKIGLVKLNHEPAAADGMHLEALWVDPQRRRRRVGALLVQAAENIAAELGARELKLWIFVENEEAQAFYARQGYGTPIRRQPLEVNGQTRHEQEYEKELRDNRSHTMDMEAKQPALADAAGLRGTDG
ncbi:GNAT family N-acetyltransferase [Kribbella sp. NPDC051770]|uniref:GNAT family N-acetyltransferase n=1 Tax=Kribbella sp. NPDC051770 TaxID=3155413 RepID=UPI0034331152